MDDLTAIIRLINSVDNSFGHHRHRTGTVPKPGNKQESDPKPVVAKSRCVLNQHPGPPIASGGTPSLGPPHLRLATTDTGRVQTQNRDKIRNRPPNRWWTNPSVSRTNIRTPKLPRGGTPSLGRPHPCLVTTDTGRVQAQNRGKIKYRTLNRWWPNPGVSRTNTRTPSPMHLCTCVSKEGGDGESAGSEALSMLSYALIYVSLFFFSLADFGRLRRKKKKKIVTALDHVIEIWRKMGTVMPV
jgi:hypothetical protein